MTLKQVLDNVTEALDSLQATESYCVNISRELTQHEMDAWNAAKERYHSALTQAIYRLSGELIELDPAIN